MEDWKKIDGLKSHYINRNGDVIKKFKNGWDKPTKVFISPRGYKYFNVSEDKETITIMVHRAVANAFIPNPENYEFIKHIDHNKLNNNVNNLMWCATPKKNIL